MARLGKFAYRCRSGMCDSWFHVYVVGSFVKELHVLFAISFGDISNIDPWGRQDQLICEPCALLWPLPVLQYFEYLRCHIGSSRYMPIAGVESFAMAWPHGPLLPLAERGKDGGPNGALLISAIDSWQISTRGSPTKAFKYG